ncbi:MAG: M24 family metallopeptidase [Vampirovibrionales bacterium]
MTALERLQALRQWMRQQPEPLDAYWVPSSDEFGNEYVPQHLNRRAFLTGFTGSAGDAVVSHEEAWLWVDGRYHEQVDAEVDNRCWTVSKQGQPKQPTMAEVFERWVLALKPQQCLVVGFPGACVSHQAFQKLKESLKLTIAHRIQWQCTDHHGVDEGWTDRPPFLPQKAYGLAPSTAGQSVEEKLARLADLMATHSVAHVLLTTVDAVAWAFNVRGGDIPHIPVCLAYGLVSRSPEGGVTATLFTDAPFSDHDRAQHFLGQSVFLQPLHQFHQTVTQLSGRVWVDPKVVSAGLMLALQSHQVDLETTANPVYALKAIKNSAEQRGMRLAHEQASVALAKVWHRLHRAAQAGNYPTEAQVSDWVYEAYADHSAFVSLSFPSIVGFGSNAAIVHYSAPSPTRVLQPGEWVLIDSGAQYYCLPEHDAEGTGWMGTTDTTRTLVVGALPQPAQQKAYTAVMKAHCAVAHQRFVAGTTGAQLDVLVRAPLWQQGLDFLHGTGHGVGCFLSVHEGPNGISKGYSVALKPGMMTSIEPGYYRSGWGGIRLENVAVTTETTFTLEGTEQPLLGFEPLQCLPFDGELIQTEALTPLEREWLNTYHQQSLAQLKPWLNPDVYAFLCQKAKLKPLNPEKEFDFRAQ